MELYLTVTPDGIKEYPFHSHDVYEIIYYVNGEGYLHTTERDYPFKEGTVIIVPPHVKHRSISKDGFKNICVHTDDVMLDERDVISFFDNAERDGAVLVKMLMRAYFNDIDKNGFLSMRLDRKQSGESNFKVMLLKDLVNMIPLTNADNILIRSK